MVRKCFFKLILSFLLFLPSVVEAVPPMPYKIGGTVTVNGTILDQTTDTGYTFAVTKADGSSYTPAAEDTDGFNASDWYIIDIPIYDDTDQPGGANPGETAVIHVYKDGLEVGLVTSPTDGEIIIGDSGSTKVIHLEVESNQPLTVILTDTDTYYVSADTSSLIYGSKDDNKIVIESGADVKTANFPGNNTVEFETDADQFSVLRSGATVIFSATDGTRLEIPASESVQTIKFKDDVSLDLVVDSNQVLLGTQVVTTTPALIDVGSEGIGECGAYIAPGVWKEFDCYNLAAIGKTTGDDPFTPSWRLIGGYWQWGRKGPSPSELTIWMNNPLSIKTGNNPVEGFLEIAFSVGGTEVIVDITTIADDDTLDYTTAYDEIVDAINAQLAANGLDNVSATRGPMEDCFFGTSVAGFLSGDYAGVFYPILVTNTGSEELIGGSFSYYYDTNYIGCAMHSSHWYDTNTSNFAHGPTGPDEADANDDEISGWDESYAPDGAWSDAYKTADDPCPAGYRVPTETQWEGVSKNNTQYIVGTWSDDYSNYSSARFFGDDLMLPAAGYRYSSSGSLSSRGDIGNYWSSTGYSSSSTAWNLYFNSSYASMYSYYRSYGFSVRCVAE